MNPLYSCLVLSTYCRHVGGCPKEEITKTSTRRPALVYSLMWTEVLQATLNHSAHLTSYGLLSCNQCEVYQLSKKVIWLQKKSFKYQRNPHC